ncbi:MAG: aldo/keto reductase [Lachnospiraceae bacterium]|nr:aldo/keto reductase [Lachnospiraceae bacterium]
MQKRTLGKSNLTVQPIGLGCMGFSHASGDPTDKDTAVRRIREAADIGYDFFDTAECYTGIYPDGSISCNEELVGEALKGIRDKVIIATKMGVSHNADRSLRLDSSPSAILASIDQSLKKLQTDYVDIYYQHRIDPGVEPEIVAETFGRLIREGKIRAWGISETTEEYLRRADAVCPVAVIQNRYSMMARWHEHIFPVCEELNVGYVAFSPLANGILTGMYDATTQFEGAQDYRAAMPQYTEEGHAKAKELLDYLQMLSKEKNATSGQIALSWVLGQRPYIVPIPGSRKAERIKENFAAGDMSLTADEMQKIDELLERSDFMVFGGHGAEVNRNNKSTRS